MVLTYTIEKECIVKDFLKEAGLSHALLKKIKNLDNIRINGEYAKNWYTLKKGDQLALAFQEEMNDEIVPSSDAETLKVLDIIYEDEYFLVVNKPSYISSMPSRKHQEDNILSIVKNYLLKKNENCNMHLINRLDFQTSGLIIIAKSGIIHYEFSKIEIIKKYLCVVQGLMKDENGVIELPISRYPAPEIKRYVDIEKGQYAKTIYQVIEKDINRNRTQLEVTLVTGRTHQIRVHFSYLGFPLIGDKLYNDCLQEGDKELLLHAFYLSFIHPITKELLTFINYPNWFSKDK